MVTPMAPQPNKTDPRPRRRKKTVASLALVLVGAALLSGCTGLGGSDANRAPRAELSADRTQGWTGDEFTFDAQGSSDPDGNITSWEFDFGDGTRQTVTQEEAARATHAYLEGGEYVVTVTVIDDGTQDGLERKSDEDSIHVFVDERFPVAAQVIRAQALNTTAGSSMAVPFEANDGADRAHVNVSVQNTLLAGGSEVRLRVLDPAGNVLDEQTVSLPDTQVKDIEFDVLLDSLGNHTLEIVADSGSARVTGDLEVYYGDKPDFDKMQAEA